MVAGEPIQRGGGQIIPTARRVAYSAFLMVCVHMCVCVDMCTTIYIQYMHAHIELYIHLVCMAGYMIMNKGKTSFHLAILWFYTFVMSMYVIATCIE